MIAEKVERSKASSSSTASKSSGAGSAFSNSECVNCVTALIDYATMIHPAEKSFQLWRVKDRQRSFDASAGACL